MFLELDGTKYVTTRVNYLKALTTLFRVRRRMLFLRSSLLLAMRFEPSSTGCCSESDLHSSALRLLDSCLLRHRRRMEISVGDDRFGLGGWELTLPPAKMVVVGDAGLVSLLLQVSPDREG